MRIGIDVSQLAYKNTGVANYLWNLVRTLVKENKDIQFVLFFSSMRGGIKYQVLSSKYKNVELKKFRLPPTFLDFLWNKMHVMPIENFIGQVDLFITSDWTEPPTKKAKKATIIYDLIVYKHPEETDKKIVQTQKRKLKWVKKESDIVFCISESTKNDASRILDIPPNKLKVVYPGII